ncbi:ATP-binding protein [Kiloniella laminariae]|uniref:histidine kinase n=1 Tax=Kiloniella laminariae TaxID=454162 RepID=A0ABT4LM11_9PROT|nr:ATP-binding protein [Kiloniella laminariae]MCZ4281970.1 ATP-binding protein [Kiloniella laminariae]
MKIKLPHLSLSLKFALSIGGVFFLINFIFEGVISETSEHFMEKEIDSRLQAKINDMNEVYELGGIKLLQALIDRRAKQELSDSRIYLLTDQTYNKLSGNIAFWPEKVPKIPGFTEVEDDHLNPVEFRFLSMTLGGQYHLLLGLDTSKEEELEDQVFLFFLGALLLSISGGTIAGIILHRGLKKRLSLINVTCSEIMIGRFSKRIPVSRTSDEIDVMAHTLNSMLDRVESLMDGIRHVTDNIAHDLRTPLTRLHGRLERLVSLTEEGKNRRLVEAAIAEVDQLLVTFSALLGITRLETGEQETNFAPMPLGTLIADAIDIYEPIAEDRGQSIILNDHTNDNAGYGNILGDRDLITQCFSNLIDNALKYGPANSKITIDLFSGETDIKIVVHDEGSGIPEDEQSNVLERFYRVESSRNLPGNGLGLSLVAAVVRLHNGQLKLENKNGFQVIISLPKQ